MDVMSRFAGQNRMRNLGLLAVLGFIASGAMAWLLVAIANVFPDKSMIAGLDDSITNWAVLHGNDGADSLFRGISLLGGPLLIALVLIVAAVFAARRDWTRLSIVAIACGGGALLNVALKTMFLRARPVDATQFVNAAQAWSFPSGHAMNSLISYGILTCLLITSGRLARGTSTALIAFVTVLVAAIGYTRVYLGVHFMSDVVMGYAAGGMWLLVCIIGYRAATRGVGREPDLLLESA
jgi:undecaprenyl-diphosphatase